VVPAKRKRPGSQRSQASLVSIGEMTSGAPLVPLYVSMTWRTLSLLMISTIRSWVIPPAWSKLTRLETTRTTRTDRSVYPLDNIQNVLYVSVMAQSKSGSVRERLLNAADELFYRDGVNTVGVERVLQQAGVAKASLYGTFGSKEELVRAYLEERARRVQERIENQVSTATEPRAQMLAIFDGLIERAKDADYHGCPFIRACAEAPPGANAARDVSATHRAWRQGFFASLAKEAGVRDASGFASQLAILYDGAACAVSMDGSPGAAVAARNAVARLLEEQSGAAPKRRASKASVKRASRHS
jgi:AcrR family transcriptional regulator